MQLSGLRFAFHAFGPQHYRRRGATDMAQQVKEPVSKPDRGSMVPSTHMVGKKTDLLTSAHVPCHMHAHTATQHVHVPVRNVIPFL